jgi:hypothetical protein
MSKIEFTEEQRGSGVVYRRDQEEENIPKAVRFLMGLGVKTRAQANIILIGLCLALIVASFIIMTRGNNDEIPSKAQNDTITYPVPEEDL